MPTENPPPHPLKFLLIPLAVVIVFFIIAQTVNHFGAKKFFQKRFETISIGDHLNDAQGLLGPPEQVLTELDPGRFKPSNAGYRIGKDEGTKEYLIWTRDGTVFIFGLNSEAKVTLAAIYH
ncbi:MAG TPA: hypothetical protein VIU33_08800 [Nitrospiria bacterium]